METKPGRKQAKRTKVKQACEDDAKLDALFDFLTSLEAKEAANGGMASSLVAAPQR